MKITNYMLMLVLALTVATSTVSSVDAKRLGHVERKEQGWRGGWGGGGGGGGQEQALHQVLVQNRNKIDRDVNYTYPGGVWTKTFAKNATKDPDVNYWILQHINEMKALAESGGTIRTGKDELFAEIFDKLQHLNLTCNFENGVAGAPVVCTHTGIDDNCYATALARAHAETVSRFLTVRGEPSRDHGYLIGEHCDDGCDECDDDD